MNLQVAVGGVVILWCSYMTIVIWHDKYLVMWHKTLWQQHDHDQAQLWSPHYRLHNCKYFNVDTLGFNVYCQHCYLTGAGTLRIIYDLNVVILVRISPISSLVHEKTESHVLHSTANLFIHLPPLICLPGAWCWNKLRIVTHPLPSPLSSSTKNLEHLTETILHQYDVCSNWNVLICSTWPRIRLSTLLLLQDRLNIGP